MMLNNNTKKGKGANIFDRVDPIDSLIPVGMFSKREELSDVHQSNLRKIKTGSTIKIETIANKNLVGPVKPERIENSSSSSSEDESEPEILKNIRLAAQATTINSNKITADPSKNKDDDSDEEDAEDHKLQERIDPEINQEFNKKSDSDSSESDEDREEDFDFKASGIPSSHEVILKGHTKTITALALDQPGVRLASGSYDHGLRLWDFQGMNKNMNSFRILEPIPGNSILSLSFSSSNQEILVVAGTAQPKIISRDGKELSEFIKGDMYIKDMANTKGHTAMVNDGSFHPTEKNLLATCSLDGTIRLWDRNLRLVGIEQQMSHKSIIKCKDAKGIKVNIYKMSYSPDGKLILGMCSDGSVQGFNTGGTFHRPDVRLVLI